MPSIRSLRRNRGMTLVELALEAGIPARTLGAVEHNIQRLDPDCAARLAQIFDIAPELLYAAERPPRRAPHSLFNRLRRTGPPLVATLLGGLLLVQPVAQRPPTTDHRPPIVDEGPRIKDEKPGGQEAEGQEARDRRQATRGSEQRTRDERQGGRDAGGQEARDRRQEITGSGHLYGKPSMATESGMESNRSAPARSAQQGATPTSQPPAPAFHQEADGPHGCPLLAEGGRIVITQGYSEGTHVPAESWGAIDLAVDGDGDGVAEPGPTDGRPIVATHEGIARVFWDSWPGGNFVLVENAQTGWDTAYAHLSDIAVADGQAVSAGTPLGSTGSTGMATGPHLHYEVRYQGVNLDPSGLIECDE